MNIIHSVKEVKVGIDFGDGVIPVGCLDCQPFAASNC